MEKAFRHFIFLFLCVFIWFIPLLYTCTYFWFPFLLSVICFLLSWTMRQSEKHHLFFLSLPTGYFLTRMTAVLWNINSLLRINWTLLKSWSIIHCSNQMLGIHQSQETTQSLIKRVLTKQSLIKKVLTKQSLIKQSQIKLIQQWQNPQSQTFLVTSMPQMTSLHKQWVVFGLGLCSIVSVLVS